MATFSPYRFPVPEASKLASLESIKRDLEGVLAYCECLEEMRVEPFDSLLWEAVSAAAVVRYARCFSTGAREPLDHNLLNSAPQDIKEAHEYMMNVRNKHVAHSVNAFEENEVTVTLREDGDSLEIMGVGAHHGRITGLAFHQPEQLRAVSTWVAAQVSQAIAIDRDAILAIARTHGAPAIKAFGIPSLGETSTPDTAKRRRARP